MLCYLSHNMVDRRERILLGIWLRLRAPIHTAHRQVTPLSSLTVILITVKVLIRATLQVLTPSIPIKTLARKATLHTAIHHTKLTLPMMVDTLLDLTNE